MTDPWWPSGYDDPAFQVQRDIYGSVVGGDYVRGSAQFKGTLSGAGTAMPTSPVEGDMWLIGSDPGSPRRCSGVSTARYPWAGLKAAWQATFSATQ